MILFLNACARRLGGQVNLEYLILYTIVFVNTSTIRLGALPFSDNSATYIEIFIICLEFLYRFRKGICHRAVHDKESVFTLSYWFATTAPPTFEIVICSQFFF